jgi:hypothetical protein
MIRFRMRFWITSTAATAYGDKTKVFQVIGGSACFAADKTFQLNGQRIIVSKNFSTFNKSRLTGSSGVCNKEPCKYSKFKI